MPKWWKIEFSAVWRIQSGPGRVQMSLCVILESALQKHLKQYICIRYCFRCHAFDVMSFMSCCFMVLALQITLGKAKTVRASTWNRDRCAHEMQEYEHVSFRLPWSSVAKVWSVRGDFRTKSMHYLFQCANQLYFERSAQIRFDINAENDTWRYPSISDIWKACARRSIKKLTGSWTASYSNVIWWIDWGALPRTGTRACRRTTWARRALRSSTGSPNESTDWQRTID